MCKQINQAAKSVTQLQLQALKNYNGINMQRINHTLKNFKSSTLYVLGTLALFGISTFYFDKRARNFVLGQNNRGGKYLTIVSGSSNFDYYYNRQFQRMMYLSQNVAHGNEDDLLTDRLLANMGGEVKHYPYQNVIKKAAHPKYL